MSSPGKTGAQTIFRCLHNYAESTTVYENGFASPFNMLPASLGYAILTGPDESFPLMRDSYNMSEKRPSGPGFTFNGFSDRPGAGRIDYIFVKRGMRVKDHTTLVEEEKGVFISDHWPVKATVLLKDD